MTKLNITNESLKKAIEEFNAYTGNARIYYNREDKTYWTEVFINDVNAVGTFNVNENVMNVFSKSEIEGTINIGSKRLAYIDLQSKYFDEGNEAFLCESWAAKELDYAF